MTVAQKLNRQVMAMGMPGRRPTRRILWHYAVIAVTTMTSALSSCALAADPASARKRGGKPISGGDNLA